MTLYGLLIHKSECIAEKIAGKCIIDVDTGFISKSRVAMNYIHIDLKSNTL